MAGSAHYPFEVRIKGSLTKGLLIALALSLIPVAAVSAQKIIPGSTCKVYKQKVTNQNKVYTCIKSGKKLVWSKGVTVVKPTPTPTPTPTPAPTVSSNKAFGQTTISVQTLLDNLVIRDYSDQVNLIIKVEPGSNGIYPELLIKNLKYAINFYGSIGMLPKYQEIFYAFGRHQEWLEAQTKENCKNQLSPVNSSVFIGKCIVGENRVGFLTNLPNILNTGSSIPNPDADFSLIKIREDLVGNSCGTNCLTQSAYLAMIYQPSHELFHAFQLQSWPNIGNWYERHPQWFIEGSAETFARLVIAKETGLSNAFGIQTGQFYPHFDSGPEGAINCNMKFKTLYERFLAIQKNSPYTGECAYSFGSLAIDQLLVELGSFDNFAKLVGQMNENSFADSLQNVSSLDIEMYFTKVDSYARYFKYAAKSG